MEIFKCGVHQNVKSYQRLDLNFKNLVLNILKLKDLTAMSTQ